MFSRRAILIGISIAAAMLSTAAPAIEKQNFDASVFAAAQQAGKSIFVEIHATWCPTCKAQAPILSKLEEDPKFKDLVVFHVDFDSQKEAVKSFGAQMQSTLIAFKGTKETARSVGDTNPESIAALLNSAI
ncbi:MAG: TlpA family protein disulfide reductase [Hyphomicrobiales bacterium]